MRRLCLALASLALATPVFAAATDWQELAPDTRVRLVAAETLSADGKTLLGIELDMPAGTKTYWKVPGETGIATRLDLAGSTGIAGHRLVFPYPQVEQKGGYTDFVYFGPVVIPVELAVDSDRPVVEASLFMGICSDICVPATAEFTLPLDLTAPDPGQDIRLRQALSATPLPWTGSGEPVGELRYDPASRALLVRVDTAIVDPASLRVDANSSGYLFGAPQKSREPDLVALPLLGRGDVSGSEAVPVQVVFMTPDGAFEVTRELQASTPGAH